MQWICIVSASGNKFLKYGTLPSSPAFYFFSFLFLFFIRIGGNYHLLKVTVPIVVHPPFLVTSPVTLLPAHVTGYSLPRRNYIYPLLEMFFDNFCVFTYLKLETRWRGMNMTDYDVPYFLHCGKNIIVYSFSKLREFWVNVLCHYDRAVKTWHGCLWSVNGWYVILLYDESRRFSSRFFTESWGKIFSSYSLEHVLWKRFWLPLLSSPLYIQCMKWFS